MQPSRLVRLSVLGSLLFANALRGQAAPLRVAIGVGLLTADNGRSGLLSSRGVTGFVRLTPAGSFLLFEASLQHLPRNRDIVVVPCPSPPVSCDTDFTGPSTALAFAPGIQVSEHAGTRSGVALLYRIGPSVSWYVGRERGADPVALGARAGVSARWGRQAGALLLSADYFRLFHAGSSPRWFLPITVGAEF